MAHILLVEGDEGIRDALDFLLSDAGYRVTPVGSAQEGLTVLQAAHAEAMVVLVNQRQRAAMSGVNLYDADATHLGTNAHNAFIIMSATAPERHPEEITKLLARANVPIMVLPADIDTVESLIGGAAQRADKANAGQTNAASANGM